MSTKQKTVKTISIVEVISGLLYCIEGFIVSSGKLPYFIAAAIILVTAIFCYMAATDASKAKPATILLWITIVLNLAGGVIGLINKSGATNIALSALGVCIAAYLIKQIKEIHK